MLFGISVHEWDLSDSGFWKRKLGRGRSPDCKCSREVLNIPSYKPTVGQTLDSLLCVYLLKPKLQASAWVQEGE